MAEQKNPKRQKREPTDEELDEMLERWRESHGIPSHGPKKESE